MMYHALLYLKTTFLLVLVPSSWHRASQTVRNSSVKRASFAMNNELLSTILEFTLTRCLTIKAGPFNNFRIGAGDQKKKKAGTFSPTPQPLRREEGLETEVNHMANYLIIIPTQWKLNKNSESQGLGSFLVNEYDILVDWWTEASMLRTLLDLTSCVSLHLAVHWYLLK